MRFREDWFRACSVSSEAPFLPVFPDTEQTLRKEKIMKKFWTYIKNEKFSLGCTERAVYLYDAAGKELAQFKDISHCGKAAFAPDGDIFAVKSTGAYFAVYSAEKAALIKKVKFSDVDGSQDDGFCFSADGKYFYNVERQKSSVHSAISVYDTNNFERIAIFCDKDDKTEPSYIENGNDGRMYVLGFLRGDNRVMSDGFAARFGENGLEDIRKISREDYNFHHNFKRLELYGFTEMSKKWSKFSYDNVDMTGMENTRHPLSELWEKYKK